MSAVVAFVEDVFDAVGDVIEAVGDVVEDVVEFVGDAVEKVGDVVQAVLDDPLPVLLSVAGSFVGIPPFVTMGAITAARGGDLEDIALSMGTAYFAPQAGNFLSSTVSSAFIDAGFNEAFTQVASDSISKGLVNGTIAEIRGGEFDDGFAGGFTGGLVSGGVGEVASYVKPDIIDLALDSGLDLNQATSVFNAGVKAVTAGVTSEITGKNDFVTSFTNSAIGSTVDIGTRSLNTTIDTQFNTASTGWNDTSKNDDKVDTTVVGGGIPDTLVGQVTVSSIGVDTTADTTAASTIDTTKTNSTSSVANVLANSSDATNTPIGETATSNISTLPETQLAQAPTGETVTDFTNIIDTQTPTGANTVVASSTDGTGEIPASVIDIADTLPTGSETVASTEPKGGLTTLVEASATPTVDLTNLTKPAVVSEAPVSENLLTAGLTPEQPTGGLNAVAQTTEATPEAKMASSLGLKPTDITKPVVATVGSLLKQGLSQQKKPAQRAPVRPAGGLQMASAKPVPNKPPLRMDVAKLIPIQKAAPLAPPKTLASTAKLNPVTNIAGLTSLVKKTG